MTTNLVRAAPSITPATTRGTTPTDLVDSFLAGLKPATIRAYSTDLASFAAWVGTETPSAAAERVLVDQGHANRLAHDWRADMLEQGLAPATINRRLAALRGVVKLANRVGMVGWLLSVSSVKSRAYRDTTGPGRQVIVDMLAHLARLDTPKAARDAAIVRLLYERGLRRGEVVSLDVDDVDLDGRRVRVLGKGDRERRWLTIPLPTRNAIAWWLDRRGDRPGPLFVRLDRARDGLGRLTGDSVARMVCELGKAVGVPGCRPHGLRHAAVTDALDRTGGDVRRARVFSRHRTLETLLTYDDNRADFGGELADLIAIREVDSR